jgi:ClpP class serine protease
MTTGGTSLTTNSPSSIVWLRNEIFALANDVRWPLTQTQRDRLIDATLALDDAIREMRKEKQPGPVSWRQALGDDPQ